MKEMKETNQMMQISMGRDDLLERRLQDAEGELQTASCRLRAVEREVSAMRRRLSATWALAFIGSVGGLVMVGSPQARAQFGVTLTSLNNRLNVVEAKMQDMSRLADVNTNQPTVRFSGVNVQVVNGSGSTDGAVNGLGNLIVGYNELRGAGGTNVRIGSHNLIVGSLNNYSSFGGFVAGIANTVRGQYASVSGGNANTASFTCASVSGGRFNTASGEYASVSGGSDNNATIYAASVSGGFDRNATDFYDWRAGGLFQDF